MGSAVAVPQRHHVEAMNLQSRKLQNIKAVNRRSQFVIYQLQNLRWNPYSRRPEACPLRQDWRDVYKKKQDS